MYKAIRNANLTELTTFGTRAECGCLVTYDTLDDLRQLAKEQPELLRGDLFCLGGGSNVIFVDDVVNATILHCTGNAITEVESVDNIPDNVCLRVQAGTVLDHLVDFAAERQLWGLENLAGIPGCVGGAAVQNVGAYGAEFADCVVAVRAFDIDTFEVVVLPAEKCEYAYRHSYFKSEMSKRLSIFEVELRLSKNVAPKLEYSGVREALGDLSDSDVTPLRIARAIRYVRATKLPDPRVVGSAGSYFKNPVVSADEFRTIEDSWDRHCRHMGVEPIAVQHHCMPDGCVKLSAAWLIDKAGCKPFSKGGAALWPSQPLVLVNRTTEATGADVLALQHEVQNRVKAVFGVMLHPEVVQVGNAVSKV